VVANERAMSAALDLANTIDRAAILAMHEALLMRSDPSIAGHWREEQVWVGGSKASPHGADFVPPHHERLIPAIDDLLAFIERDDLPVFAQAAIAHAQFETIHPFADGNGRTGRALIHVVLRRRGLAPAYVPPISVVLAADKGRYINGLTRFRNNDVDGWLVDFAAAAAQGAKLAECYLGAVERLQEQWRQQVRDAMKPRSDAAVWRLIDVLPAHPVVTLPVAVAAIARTKAVVNQALDQLERAGVLARMSGGERNRSWEATGLLDLLAGLENGTSPAGEP
jgi:Fic family protein